jgi:signal transduction histidine kinase
MIHILLVEDNPADARLLRESLAESRAAPFELTHVERLDAALARLDAERFDVVLLDLSLPDSAGLDTLSRAHARFPGVPIVVLTGQADKELALEAIRQGAQDYLVKGQVDGNLLVRAIRYAIERKAAQEVIRQWNVQLEQRVAERTAELAQSAAALQAANERLKALERLKSQFLTQASHELRTPLTNIKTSLYLLERGRPEKRDYYLSTLTNEADLLQMLVEDLLEAGSLDFGQAQPALVPLDLNQFVAAQAQTRIAVATGRRLTLKVETDPSLPLVLADAKLLKQVVANLMLDVADRSPGGGAIILRTEKRQTSEPGQGAAWGVLVVSNTAAAAAPADAGRRTGPAGALGQSTAPGAGLRLAICQEIIQHHGGRLTIESAAITGYTITVWLAPADGRGNTEMNR